MRTGLLGYAFAPSCACAETAAAPLSKAALTAVQSTIRLPSHAALTREEPVFIRLKLLRFPQIDR
jgi:hypothetical protein